MSIKSWTEGFAIQAAWEFLKWLFQPQLLAGYMTGLSGIVLSIYDGKAMAETFTIALWTFAGGFVIARNFFNWRTIASAKPRALPTPAPPVSPILPEERIITNVTPMYLMRLFDGHTNLQGSQLTVPFQGKWMRVSGKFKNITAYDERVSLDLEEPGLINSSPRLGVLSLWFNKSWIDRLSVLRLGEGVTVLGKIGDIGRHSVTLQDCELVSHEATNS